MQRKRREHEGGCQPVGSQKTGGCKLPRAAQEEILNAQSMKLERPPHKKLGSPSGLDLGRSSGKSCRRSKMKRLIVAKWRSPEHSTLDKFDSVTSAVGNRESLQAWAKCDGGGLFGRCLW